MCFWLSVAAGGNATAAETRAVPMQPRWAGMTWGASPHAVADRHARRGTPVTSSNWAGSIAIRRGTARHQAESSR